MRHSYRNHIHLEGWAAKDISFENTEQGLVASLLLAMEVDLTIEDGATRGRREMFDIEVRKKDLRFIPIIEKGTNLIVDGILTFQNITGSEHKKAVIRAYRLQLIDWEGYKKATGMTEAFSEKTETGS